MCLRKNPIIRRIVSVGKLFNQYFISKKRFGFFCEGSSIIPPYWGDTKNITVDPHTYIGPRACLSATNAKITFKGNTSVGEELTIHTGNHARKIGVFHNCIVEDNKPLGYDKDVVFEEDVWIGYRLSCYYFNGCDNGCDNWSWL